MTMNSLVEREPYLSRRDFLKLTGRLGLTGLIAGGLGGWTYATQIEPGWLEVVEIPLVLPRLDTAFSGFRMAQIGDIHMGDWMTRDRLARIVDVVLEQKPDLVAITGDFVIGYKWRGVPQDDLDNLALELRRLSDAHPTVAVMGNHDHWGGVFSVRNMLIDANIIELQNSVFSLKRGDKELHFCGVDDVMLRFDDLNAVLDGLPNAGAAVLLAHEPDFADVSAATGRFDLQISGHSHGGQVIIPGGAPLVTRPLARKYPLGWYKIGAMQQYTNRGVGMSNLNIRFNCRPEVTVFTLSAA